MPIQKITTGILDTASVFSSPTISGNLSLDSTGTTGVRVPSANTLAFHTAGTEDMRIDSSGNIGIGATTISSLGTGYTTLQTQGTNGSGMYLFRGASTAMGWLYGDSGGIYLGTVPAIPLRFYTADTERMRIDSSGRLLVGTTATTTSSTQSGEVYSTGAVGFMMTNTTAANYALSVKNEGTSGTRSLIRFYEGTGGGTARGSITTDGATVAYNTTSDYRLKENIAPMTGALAKIAQLKPCTYTWKEDGTDGQGFIAHELQAVVPDCVTGEKDAIDEEGNPVYQGIDTSFLVATLIKAIQELNEKVEAQAVRIAELESN
jgi:hypothetical protein